MPDAAAQYVEQQPQLFGSGAVGSAQQGYSVAISADGNTAAIGGNGDNSGVGAVWVFIRSNGAWTQQGDKLVGTGATGSGQQGFSVALSADGNTLAVGAPYDENDVAPYQDALTGAVWVFTRSGGTWSQQGSKLVGTGIAGPTPTALQGYSVALSADGNTLVAGAPCDNSTACIGNGTGAAWVFTRGDGVWNQQTKLSGTGTSGAGASQGFSVALSADGNTAILGGPTDYDPNNNVDTGATWIFTRSNETWTQQGSKLIGSNGTGAMQGSSVALSADGATAIVGGPQDYAGGADWIFTLSNGVWTEQGSKLVNNAYPHRDDEGGFAALSSDGNIAWVSGTNAVDVFVRNNGAWSQQVSNVYGSLPVCSGAGESIPVAISSTGSVGIVSSERDNNDAGGVCPYIRYAGHDFNADATSDILWRDTSGDLAMWLMNAGAMSSGASISQVPTSWSVVGTHDFNNDGAADILWLDNVGDLAIWLMNGATVTSGISLGNVGTQWSVVGIGDFNGDGFGDILWRNTSTGDVAIWVTSDGSLSSAVDLGAVPANWQIAGTGDFNGDGTTDILWRDTQSGDLAIWLLNQSRLSSGIDLGTVPLTWTVVGTGDFNSDGTADILWRDTSGDLAIWLIGNGQLSSGATLGNVPTTWSIAETGDFDGDGKSDILWDDQSGDLAIWLMNGTKLSSGLGLGNVGTSWTVQGQNAD